MLAQMYSIRELDRSIRVEFDIPQDPYDRDEVKSDEAGDYLRALGIFFYRDEENQFAIILQPDDDNPEAIFDRKGFFGFRQLVELHPRQFTVMPWKMTTPEKWKKEGDDRAWLAFNEKKYLEEVSINHIKTS